VPELTEPATDTASLAQYETAHRRVRQALAATPTGVAFPSTAFQDSLAFEHRTAVPLDDLVAAARGMLRFGQHEGPCTNHDDASGTERCVFHAEAFERREATLRAALDALDEASDDAH
jgi:hypothetical protein